MFTRTSMEPDEDDRFSRNVSNLAGAIFMCNRTTKKECLRRKIFALPHSGAEFVKKVKAGMFLFLFEYEQRKLYGVFEAASNGMIMSGPGSFTKSGRTYPAQVHFNDVWICHPLSENEFRDAIQENYYSSHKFNLGLSYNQVVRLVELFSLKKINLQNRPSPGFHSKGNYNLDNIDANGRANCKRFDTTECGPENDTKLESRFGVDYSMYNQNPSPISGYHKVGTGHGSPPRLPGEHQSQFPNPVCSTSQTDRAFEGCYLASPKQHPFHQIVPAFRARQPSAVLDACNLAHKLTEPQALHFRNQISPPETFDLPKSDNFIESILDKPNVSQSFTQVQVPHFLYPSQQDPGTFSLSPTNCGLVLPSTHDGSHFQNYNYHSSQNYVKYHSTNSGLYSTNATDSVHSVNGRSNVEGHIEVPRWVDNARGLRYWNQVPDNSGLPLVEDENLIRSVEAPYFSSRSPPSCDDTVYDGAGDDYFALGNPPLASMELETNAFPRRKSVFSRLKDQRRFGRGYKVSDGHRKSSQDLLRLLSQRTRQWNKTDNTSKRSLTWSREDSGKRLENVDQVEPAGADAIDESASDGETRAEESIETPFLNFKRRSQAQKVDGGTVNNTYGESSKGECKKRKLVRPSFSDDDPFAKANSVPKKLDNSCEDVFAINSTVLSAESHRNEGTSVLQPNFGNGEYMNLKCRVEGLGDYRKEDAATIRVSEKLPVIIADEKILGSKATAQVDSEAHSIESGGRESKVIEEEFYVAGDEGSKHNMNGEKNTSSKRNSEHNIIEADVRCEENRSPLVCEKNTLSSDTAGEETHLETDARFPDPDSAIEGGQPFNFDLNHPVIKSWEISEKTEMNSGGNAGKELCSSTVNYSDTTAVNSVVAAALAADPKYVSSTSDMDAERKDNIEQQI